MFPSTDDYAEKVYFVVPVYIFAFVPWVYYAAVDHIDSRWKPVGDLWQTTILALVLFVMGEAVLIGYIVVQGLAGDWKEAMAAIVVVLGTFFPVQRVLRQLWVLRANYSLGQFLRTTFGQWEPGNNNSFFDNDNPGEGITDITLWPGWGRLWRKVWGMAMSLRGDNQKQEAAFTFDGSFAELPQEDKLTQLHKLCKTNPWEETVRYPFRIVAGAPDDNGIARSLWLYENLVNSEDTLTNILRLGLSIQISHHMTLMNPFHLFLKWLEDSSRGDEEEGGPTAAGRFSYMNEMPPDIPSCKVLPVLVRHADTDETRVTFDDCSEAFLRLPASRRSVQANGGLIWEDFMVLVCSTLDVALWTTSLFAPIDWKGDILSLDAVLTHHMVAYIGTAKNGRRISCRAKHDRFCRNWRGGPDVRIPVETMIKRVAENMVACMGRHGGANRLGKLHDSVVTLEQALENLQKQPDVADYAEEILNLV